MKMRLGVLTALALAGSILVPSAGAEKPLKEALPPATAEFAAGEVCDFDVRIAPVAGTFGLTSFASGRELITGTATFRVTNLDTNESVVVREAGSLSTRPLPDGSLHIVGTGPKIFWFFPQDVNGKGLFHTTGRLSEVLDVENDVITSVEVRGQQRDLCAELTPAN